MQAWTVTSGEIIGYTVITQRTYLHWYKHWNENILQKKKKSETSQLPEKYVFKSLGVLTVQLEETVCSARVCSPGGVF